MRGRKHDLSLFLVKSASPFDSWRLQTPVFLSMLIATVSGKGGGGGAGNGVVLFPVMLKTNGIKGNDKARLSGYLSASI